MKLMVVVTMLSTCSAVSSSDAGLRGGHQRSLRAGDDAAADDVQPLAGMASASNEVSTAELPYSAFLFQLDMCLLSYRTWSQMLAWPHDPFYHAEDTLAGHSNAIGMSERTNLMDAIRAWWFSSPDAAATMEPHNFNRSTMNSLYDPIMYASVAEAARTNLVQPSMGAMNAGASTTKATILRPEPLSRRITQVYYQALCLNSAPSCAPLLSSAANVASLGALAVGDSALIVFEGVTGVLPSSKYPGTQSPLGVIVVRKTVAGYDLHITFRGSRSGAVGTAVLDALLPGEYTGNADWTTDMDMGVTAFFDEDFADTEGVLRARKLVSLVNWPVFRVGLDLASLLGLSTKMKIELADLAPVDWPVPLVHRGFLNAMRESLRTVIAAVNSIAVAMHNAAPQRVWVSGHSLGGALAVQFAASILLARDGFTAPANSKAARFMSPTVLAWNWPTLVKLVTFSAPAVGNKAFTNKLDAAFVIAPQHSYILKTFKTEAFAQHPEIAAGSTLSVALHYAGASSYMRVLCELDPITQTNIKGQSVHGGHMVYVSPETLKPIGSPAWHEPAIVREHIVRRLGLMALPRDVASFVSMVTVDTPLGLTGAAYTANFRVPAPPRYDAGRLTLTHLSATGHTGSLSLAALGFTQKAVVVARADKLPFQAALPATQPLTEQQYVKLNKRWSEGTQIALGCDGRKHLTLVWKKAADSEKADVMRGVGYNPTIGRCPNSTYNCENDMPTTGFLSKKVDTRYQRCVCIKLNGVAHKGAEKRSSVTDGMLWIRQKFDEAQTEDVTTYLESKKRQFAAVAQQCAV